MTQRARSRLWLALAVTLILVAASQVVVILVAAVQLQSVAPQVVLLGVLAAILGGDALRRARRVHDHTSAATPDGE